MAKRRTVFDEAEIRKRIKDGRGSGERKDYRPWLDIQDVPSLGRVSRLRGWKTGRIHELLSDYETRYFYLLEWSDEVVDIREQFPLLNREHTKSIAAKNSVRHPVDFKSKTTWVMTTDFMITVISGGKKKYIARTVKPPEELEKAKKINNFDIERTYWEELNIDWGIYEETEASRILARNISWIHSSYWPEDIELRNPGLLNEMLNILKERLKTQDDFILSVLNPLDKEYEEAPGTFLSLLRHLISRKQVAVDMFGDMNFNRIKTDTIAIADLKDVREGLA